MQSCEIVHRIQTCQTWHCEMSGSRDTSDFLCVPSKSRGSPCTAAASFHVAFSGTPKANSRMKKIGVILFPCPAISAIVPGVLITDGSPFRSGSFIFFYSLSSRRWRKSMSLHKIPSRGCKFADAREHTHMEREWMKWCLSLTSRRREGQKKWWPTWGLALLLLLGCRRVHSPAAINVCQVHL